MRGASLASNRPLMRCLDDGPEQPEFL